MASGNWDALRSRTSDCSESLLRRPCIDRRATCAPSRIVRAGSQIRHLASQQRAQPQYCLPAMLVTHDPERTSGDHSAVAALVYTLRDGGTDRRMAALTNSARSKG